MLGSETKQKIQNLRDTLVGKIPVPTEQVKQITLGLIYKFMSDIDQENKELGSKSFFSGDYEKYSWYKILDRGLSSYDRVLLYSEGLEKMALNPHIPQLFRDIFKGAFLPFRDPAIVNEFLKGINEFKYEHSEDLGDAFEFLLMVMDAQGDAGQFRTPRHIIDFIVKAVDPQKADKILDPACGTAGFLIGAYKHILKQNTAPNSNRPGSALTTIQRNNLSKNFVGYDISHDMVRLSLVNMYLHQFSDPKIYEYDTLTSLDRWEDNFDCILANPPFMTPRGGIRPHNRFAIRANRSEVLFVDYIAEHLNPSGKAGIIVPEGIIFQSANAYKALRKMLVDSGYLYAVVSLPAGVFNPYSGVKTSILLIDKTLARKAKDILFVKVENDGFDLGAQRRPIGENDLPAAHRAIIGYKEALFSGKLLNADACQKIKIIEKSKIAENNEYILSGERYGTEKVFTNIKWSMVALREVLDYEQPTNYIVNSVDYDDKYKTPVLTAGKTFILGYTNEKDGIFCQKLPVIIFDDFTTATKFVDFPFKVKSSAMKILHAKKDKANIKFIFYVMQKINFISNEHKRYWISEYSRIKVPLPPLEIQQEIATELDQYQKIIDGARQIVENYEPLVNIDPTWEIVELGKVCKLGRGFAFKSSDYTAKGVLNFRVSNIGNNGLPDLKDARYLPERFLADYEDYRLEEDDFVIVMVGATSGKIGLITKNVLPALLNQNMWRFFPNTEKMLKKFLYYIVHNLPILSQGGAQGYLKQSDFLKIKIPLPSLETQKQIVAQIEEEQKLIETNKKLIEVFERKIRDKIKDVWLA